MTLSLSIAQQVTITRKAADTRPILYVVRHDRDIGVLWRSNLPEVFPFAPSHFTPLTRAWQELSYALNPQLSRLKWRAVHADDRAFTNHHGFEAVDHPGRADWINMRDLGGELPKQEALICGGNVVTGYVSGDNLVVHTLNGRRSPPNVDELKAWEVFDAVTVDSNGTPRLFPQGQGLRVRLPLVADRTRYPVLTIPLRLLRKLGQDEPIPSAYAI